MVIIGGTDFLICLITCKLSFDINVGYVWDSCDGRYNPVLWGVPKGSYATNPNSSCRILEFRKMIQVETLLVLLFEMSISFLKIYFDVYNCIIRL